MDVPAKILVVDDEEKIRFVLSCLLGDHGYEVETASDGKAAFEAAEKFVPDLILLDLEMPVMGGSEALKELKQLGFADKVIILTAFGTIPSAVEAMRLGAYDYLTKPFVNEELLLVIERALERSRMERELTDARSRLEEQFSVGGIVTVNSEMRRLLETVVRIAPTDTPVLITGESGTGKELFAQAIHQHSARKNKAFLSLNCGALPETLIESELFGFRRGAFTGANMAKPGLVEQADGGTLLLDEIGEMGPEAQVKLLRFAQSGEFIRLGGTEAGRVDVRLIAASNQDLENAISEGRFRADLFYRLNVVSISIPPLRKRRDDIPPLVEHFLKKHGPSLGKEDYRFTPEALEVIQVHDWPGNVRELENAVHSALAMAVDTPIGADLLPLTVSRGALEGVHADGGVKMREMVSAQQETVEKRAIIDALESCGGNRSKAAKALGVGRNTLLRKMKRYGIS